MSWIIQQNPAHTVSNLNTPKAFLSSLTFNVFALMHLSQDPMMFKVNIPTWSYFCLSMCWFIRKSVFRTFQPLCVHSLFLFLLTQTSAAAPRFSTHLRLCSCPLFLLAVCWMCAITVYLPSHLPSDLSATFSFVLLVLTFSLKFWQRFISLSLKITSVSI